MINISRVLKVSWFLALRSISRGNFGLSIMTVFMLTIVYLNLVFTPSLLEGVTDLTNSKLINVLVGDILFEPKNGGENLITNPDNLKEKIENLPGVESTSTVSRTSAEISKDDEFGNWEITAISPADDKRVFNTSEYLIEGEYLSDGDLDEIVLGVQIAGANQSNIELYSESLKNVHSGNTVTVKYSNGVKKEYRVKGIFKSEFVQSDIRAFISKEEFNRVYPSRKNSASLMHVKISDGVDQQQVIQQVLAYDNNFEARTWQEKAGFIKSATDSFDLINKILQTISLFVAGITIFIVTYVDVVNKRRQIGIERAIGITPGTILTAYALRAIFYMIVGTIVGVVAFMYLVVPLEAKYPFHFPQGTVLLAINPVFMTRMVGLLLLVGLVSALIPAFRSIKIRIIDAIWSN